jgi:hypothetical protein
VLKNVAPDHATAAGEQNARFGHCDQPWLRSAL